MDSGDPHGIVSELVQDIDVFDIQTLTWEEPPNIEPDPDYGYPKPRTKHKLLTFPRKFANFLVP